MHMWIQHSSSLIYQQVILTFPATFSCIFLTIQCVEVLLDAPKRPRVLPLLLILLLLNGLSFVYDYLMGDRQLTIAVHLTLFVLTMLVVHSLPCKKVENRNYKETRANADIAIEWFTDFEFITELPSYVS